MNKHSCLSYHRHLAYLVISTQLLGCSASPGNAGQQNDVWAPPPAPSTNEAPMRPHFTAPSARHCERPMRMREVPASRNVKQEADGWWPSLGKLGKSSEKRSDAMADSAVGLAARSEAAPAAPAAPVAHFDSKDRVAPAAEAKTAATQHNRATVTATATVTAGVVDDNANFGDYLAFRNRTQVAHRPVDVSERYLLQVRDRSGRSVSDAEVRIQAPNGSAMWARTDSGGQVWVAPNAFDTSHASTYQVNVRKPGRWGTASAPYSPYTYGTAFLQRGQKSAIDVTLDASPTQSPQRNQLDLVFLIDATGSMGDEIDKLKASMHTIAAEVARLPARPDVCFGLVAYRDHGDAFLIRSHDFTNDLGDFQSALNRLQANGGGDYPEALNEALHDSVHSLSWRGDGTTRMVFLVADAPPHLDYVGPQYDASMTAALGKGIKIFSVGASGLDKQGEYIHRQLAQYTGGKFVFLTYDQAHNPASGPGRETVHDVQNYSVDTLDRLIVRLVREDLAKLAKLD
jgi:Mg-chelatase subunit ChlD